MGLCIIQAQGRDRMHVMAKKRGQAKGLQVGMTLGEKRKEREGGGGGEREGGSGKDRKETDRRPIVCSVVCASTLLRGC